LRSEGYPLPAFIGHCNKTQEINFTPGILFNVSKLLKSEVTKNNKEAYITLVLDEMKIKENILYDKS